MILSDKSSTEWFAVLEPSLRPLFRAAAPRLITEMPRGLRTLIILVPAKQPPKHGMRYDGIAASFICSAPLYRSLMKREPVKKPASLTFAMLDAVMNHRIAVDRVAIRQLPLDPERPISPSPSTPVSVIMAHRGKVGYLDRALSYIARASSLKLIPRIGLDIEDHAPYQRVIDRYPQARFFRVAPAGTGPYVIRQLLATRSRESTMAFHDSDDISCFDRFSMLTREMSETDCDLIGCHELRFHELDREVQIMRFPVDASDSLRAGPEHVMLHPSSIIRRKAFFAAGGFSTDRKIANDTQFLLRASFHLKIRNSDGFYYIRRKHANALTVAPATSLEHPVRTELLRVWHRDFADVKSGRLALSESSLRAIPSERRHRLIPLSSSEEIHA